MLLPPSFPDAIMSQYTLSINGQAHKVELAPDTPLLWVLRDALNLVGTKYGCGIGSCGACTVQVNGVPTRSCQLPVSGIGQQKITTIEGLDAKAVHPLQRAWQELDVPQCGYCQSGQIMSAAALLREHPKPSDAQIDAAMGGNLCRCATYLRIRAGIHRAAELAAQDKRPGKGGKFGKPGQAANVDQPAQSAQLVQSAQSAHSVHSDQSAPASPAASSAQTA
jgi:isoquinoline 1-oxidoreductase alpha subunit